MSVNNKIIPLGERVQEIRDRWFLMDPAYFMVLCTHQVEINPGIECGIACGNGYIYLNESYFADKNDKFLEECMKMEVMRILLKHPYQRQLPNRVKMYLSSNFVLANNMKLSDVKLKTTSEFFKTYDYDRESLEGIYDALKLPEPPSNQGSEGNGNGAGTGNGQNDGSGSSQSAQGKNNKKNNSKNNKGQAGEEDSLKDFDDGCSSTDDAFSRTQFWREDDFRTVEINNIISKIDRTNSWGTMPGDLVDTVKKSIEPIFNYKALFQQFRSTVLTSKRTLTRMKPNRRFGYDAMGSKREFTTKLLVAIDTSGSISQDDLELALGFIDGFFKYGIERIDCIQFDTQIYEKSLQKLTKDIKLLKVHGRGGTDFNDVFKYVQEQHEDYSGVIILTDGYASVPDKKWLANNYKHVKYLWCLNSMQNWKHFKDDSNFAKFGKCTYVDKKDQR